MSKLLESLNNELIDIKSKLVEIENNHAVITYKELEKNKESLVDLINKEIRNIQSKCKHPMWYHLSTEDDRYEGRRYFTCRCLECEKLDEDRAKYFKLVLIKKENYSIIKEEYDKLKSITNNYDVIFSALKEKFEDKHVI